MYNYNWLSFRVDTVQDGHHNQVTFENTTMATVMQPISEILCKNLV